MNENNLDELMGQVNKNRTSARPYTEIMDLHASYKESSYKEVQVEDEDAQQAGAAT